MPLKQNYFANYIKTYIWQFISIFFSFISLFIVIPILSSNQVVLGIYNICISVTIFLSYADFGFLGAGQKYAAEAIATDCKTDEEDILIVTKNILLIFIVLLTIVFFLLAYKPSVFIKDLTEENLQLASKLLFIIAIFCPVTIIERISQLMYSIHIEDYCFQRFTLIGSALKILSAFVFLANGKYNIVLYLLSLKLIGLLISAIAYLYACKKYSYPLLILFKIHINISIFKRMIKVALSNFISSLSWILYYELDVFAIGKMYGVAQVALFSVALSLTSFIRSFSGVLFSPYLVRFNHFIATKQFEKLKECFLNVVKYTSIVLSLGIFGIIFLRKPLFFCWVGNEYAKSTFIVIWLLLIYVLNSINTPSSYLLIAFEEVKTINFINILQPILYWGIIVIFQKRYGIEIFAISKFIIMIVPTFIYFKKNIGLLKLKITDLIKDSILKNFPFILVEFFLIQLVCIILPLEKSTKNLFVVISAGIIIIVPLMVLRFGFDNTLRNKIKKKIRRL